MGSPLGTPGGRQCCRDNTPPSQAMAGAPPPAPSSPHATCPGTDAALPITWPVVADWRDQSPPPICPETPLTRRLQGPSCPLGRRERRCREQHGHSGWARAPAAFIGHVPLCKGTPRPCHPLPTALLLKRLAVVMVKAPSNGLSGAAGSFWAWAAGPGPSLPHGAPRASSSPPC